MASSCSLLPLHITQARSKPGQSSRRRPISTTRITCGPRDNRGPLQRGRSLSSEAILAVQSLKRHHLNNTNNVGPTISSILNRLIKCDLLATISELRRQGHISLALAAFHHVRRHDPSMVLPPDPTLFASLANTLPDPAQIDDLITAYLQDKEKSGGFAKSDDVFKICRLVRVLVQKGRGEAAVWVYEAMRRGGCKGDECLYRVFMKGFERMGMWEMKERVEKDFEEWEREVFEMSMPSTSVR